MVSLVIRLIRALQQSLMPPVWIALRGIKYLTVSGVFKNALTHLPLTLWGFIGLEDQPFSNKEEGLPDVTSPFKQWRNRWRVKDTRRLQCQATASWFSSVISWPPPELVQARNRNRFKKCLDKLTHGPCNELVGEPGTVCVTSWAYFVGEVRSNKHVLSPNCYQRREGGPHGATWRRNVFMTFENHILFERKGACAYYLEKIHFRSSDEVSSVMMEWSVITKPGRMWSWESGLPKLPRSKYGFSRKCNCAVSEWFANYETIFF